ncbi:MAG: DNA polymerase IV [Chloroflexota bacterium]|nr:DNA polymerase IV [Chloroflexota bacterium]
MGRCIFHVDLDAFFVSAEQAIAPELRGKPVVVGGNPEGRGVVSSASYEARHFGIHAGMPLTAARRLCPQAVFIRANLARYRDASVRFMAILADFSPCIEPLGLDEAYLDATGCEGLYGSFHQMAVTLRERIHRELKLTASVGIASCKVVAKIASDLCKPDGLLEIAPGEEYHFLSPLPIAKLPGVGQKTERVLRGMSITTIGELASLPLSVVEKRLGKFGVIIHRCASGVDERRVEEHGEAKSISREVTFTQDTLERRFLEANLHRLCRHVSAELRCQGKKASCVTLKLRYADFKTITRQTTLKGASNVSQVIFAIALQLLNESLAQKGKAIRLIGVRVSSLSGEEGQLGMFVAETKKLECLDRAIDQIRGKYGSSSIEAGRDILAHDCHAKP